MPPHLVVIEDAPDLRTVDTAAGEGEGDGVTLAARVPMDLTKIERVHPDLMGLDAPFGDEPWAGSSAMPCDTGLPRSVFRSSWARRLAARCSGSLARAGLRRAAACGSRLSGMRSGRACGNCWADGGGCARNLRAHARRCHGATRIGAVRYGDACRQASVGQRDQCGSTKHGRQV